MPAARPLTSGAEFLCVASGHYVLPYTINTKSGAVKKIEGPQSCGFGVGIVAVDPVANYLYCRIRENGIAGLNINPSTGALTPISGSPFPDPYGKAEQLAITPNGAFLYAGKVSAPNQKNSITGYTIDADTGALSIVPGSPFSNGEVQTYDMAVTPSGSFLYITESGPSFSQISGFSIVPSSGCLTQVSGSPFATSINRVIWRLLPAAHFFTFPVWGSRAPNPVPSRYTRSILAVERLWRSPTRPTASLVAPTR
jgi:hypothetical protein